MKIRSLLSALLCAAGLLSLVSCTRSGAKQSAMSDGSPYILKLDAPITEPPEFPREMRAVWVATVGNIDWPTRPGMTTAEQQREAIAILDRCHDMNINCVILQVRTACDALYQSNIEPWSYFLSGIEGKAPDPYYDPLKFWIDESHKRGIELHAWFNPYRARPGGKYPHADNHVMKAKPEMVRKYGEMEWLDPGHPEAFEQTYNVFMDVVRRYDVDGVHMDDYFYPYPVREDPKDPKNDKEAPFPDDETYAEYRAGGGKLALDDWRRENVNKLIHDIYKAIKDEKPSVKFGLSPFGIWKPGYPPPVEGFSQYDKLYADAKLWLNEGWVDYWTPQLYWKLGAPAQPHLALLNWWQEENTHKRPIYTGNFTGRVADGDTGWAVDEITAQIGAARYAGPTSLGNVHFSMKTFLENRAGISDALVEGLYARPAIVPASTWIDDKPPAAPSAQLAKALPGTATQPTLPAPRFKNIWPRSATQPSTGPASTQESGRGFRGRGRFPTTSATSRPTTRPTELNPERSGVYRVTFSSRGDEPVWQYAVYTLSETKTNRRWRLHKVLPSTATDAILYESATTKIAAVAVSAIDRNGNESDRVLLMRDPSLVTPIKPLPKPATTEPSGPRTINGLEQ